MVCRRLTSLIVTLLVLLQSMESLALTFEGNKELAKKANKYEEMLKSRKLIMAKTNEAEKPKMEGLSDSKSFKISGASATLCKSNKKVVDRRRKMKLRVLYSKWSSFRDSHPSKSNTMNGFESLTADYHHPGSHPPRHN